MHGNTVIATLSIYRLHTYWSVASAVVIALLDEPYNRAISILSNFDKTVLYGIPFGWVFPSIQLAGKLNLSVVKVAIYTYVYLLPIMHDASTVILGHKKL